MYFECISKPTTNPMRVYPEVYSEPSRTSTMKFFCEISWQLWTVIYFHKKASSYIFEWVLNTPCYQLNFALWNDAVEDLSMSWWTVVGGLLENLSLSWWLVSRCSTCWRVGGRLSVVGALSVIGGFVIRWNIRRIWKLNVKVLEE